MNHRHGFRCCFSPCSCLSTCEEFLWKYSLSHNLHKQTNQTISKFRTYVLISGFKLFFSAIFASCFSLNKKKRQKKTTIVYFSLLSYTLLPWWCNFSTEHLHSMLSWPALSPRSYISHVHLQHNIHGDSNELLKFHAPPALKPSTHTHRHAHSDTSSEREI